MAKLQPSGEAKPFAEPAAGEMEFPRTTRASGWRAMRRGNKRPAEPAAGRAGRRWASLRPAAVRQARRPGPSPGHEVRHERFEAPPRELTQPGEGRARLRCPSVRRPPSAKLVDNPSQVQYAGLRGANGQDVVSLPQ
jgi:hypothetical protein